MSSENGNFNPPPEENIVDNLGNSRSASENQQQEAEKAKKKAEKKAKKNTAYYHHIKNGSEYANLEDLKDPATNFTLLSVLAEINRIDSATKSEEINKTEDKIKLKIESLEKLVSQKEVELKDSQNDSNLAEEIKNLAKEIESLHYEKKTWKYAKKDLKAKLEKTHPKDNQGEEGSAVEPAAAPETTSEAAKGPETVSEPADSPKEAPSPPITPTPEQVSPPQSTSEQPRQTEKSRPVIPETKEKHLQEALQAIIDKIRSQNKSIIPESEKSYQEELVRVLAEENKKLNDLVSQISLENDYDEKEALELQIIDVRDTINTLTKQTEQLYYNSDKVVVLLNQLLKTTAETGVDSLDPSYDQISIDVFSAFGVLDQVIEFLPQIAATAQAIEEDKRQKEGVEHTEFANKLVKSITDYICIKQLRHLDPDLLSQNIWDGYLKLINGLSSDLLYLKKKKLDLPALEKQIQAALSRVENVDFKPNTGSTQEYFDNLANFLSESKEKVLLERRAYSNNIVESEVIQELSPDDKTLEDLATTIGFQLKEEKTEAIESNKIDYSNVTNILQAYFVTKIYPSSSSSENKKLKRVFKRRALDVGAFVEPSELLEHYRKKEQFYKDMSTLLNLFDYDVARKDNVDLTYGYVDNEKFTQFLKTKGSSGEKTQQAIRDYFLGHMVRKEKTIINANGEKVKSNLLEYDQNGDLAFQEHSLNTADDAPDPETMGPVRLISSAVYDFAKRAHLYSRRLTAGELGSVFDAIVNGSYESIKPVLPSQPPGYDSNIPYTDESSPEYKYQSAVKAQRAFGEAEPYLKKYHLQIKEALSGYSKEEQEAYLWVAKNFDYEIMQYGQKSLAYTREVMQTPMFFNNSAFEKRTDTPDVVYDVNKNKEDVSLICAFIVGLPYGSDNEFGFLKNKVSIAESIDRVGASIKNSLQSQKNQLNAKIDQLIDQISLAKQAYKKGGDTFSDKINKMVAERDAMLDQLDDLDKKLVAFEQNNLIQEAKNEATAFIDSEFDHFNYSDRGRMLTRVKELAAYFIYLGDIFAEFVEFYTPDGQKSTISEPTSVPRLIGVTFEPQHWHQILPDTSVVLSQHPGIKQKTIDSYYNNLVAGVNQIESNALTFINSEEYDRNKVAAALEKMGSGLSMLGDWCSSEGFTIEAKQELKDSGMTENQIFDYEKKLQKEWQEQYQYLIDRAYAQIKYFILMVYNNLPMTTMSGQENLYGANMARPRVVYDYQATKNNLQIAINKAFMPQIKGARNHPELINFSNKVAQYSKNPSYSGETLRFSQYCNNLSIINGEPVSGKTITDVYNPLSAMPGLPKTS